MKILITGACGFLARRLAVELEARNHELCLLDRINPADATVFVPGRAERAAEPLVTRWPFVKSEILDEAGMLRACQGMDAVIHLAAAVTGLPEFGKQTMEANVVGTWVVLDAARKAGVKRVLCASSINAFGTIYWRLSGKPAVYHTMPLTEDFPVVPEDPYSMSKHFNELTCDAFTRAYGLTTAAFRFAGVWGDEQYRKTKGQLSPTQNWSNDLFQWVHIDDIALGLRQAVECPELPAQGVYTLGGPDTRCPEPSMELLNRFKPEFVKTLTEPLDGRSPLMSIQKARTAFGYSPRYWLGPE